MGSHTTKRIVLCCCFSSYHFCVALLPTVHGQGQNMCFIRLTLDAVMSWHNSDSTKVTYICYPKVAGNVLLRTSPSTFTRTSWHNILNCTLTSCHVPCSPGAAVLWLQHHPGPEVRGRGLLQPRGHHLHPLTQGLQTPILH